MERTEARTKEEVRREALARRDAIDADARESRSRRICGAVLDDETYVEARAIHVYLPIGSEVDIWPLIRLSWETGKEVGMMRVMEDGGTAQYAITPETTFRRSHIGIMEPIEAEIFDMNLCDLVIVPVVAADLQCNRLGYGRGYYDQFLTHFPRPTLGVAFEEQIFEQLPVDERDIQLDSVYTDERLLTAEEEE